MIPVSSGTVTSKDFVASEALAAGDWVNIWNDATVDMTGGVVEFGIDTYNTSTLNVSSGDVYSIDLHDESIVNLSGGLRIVEGLHRSTMYPDTGTVNIYGRDLEWVIDSMERVHGYWIDGSEFRITFARIENATINLYEIPEPCTFGLVGLGFFILRRKPKILHK